MRDSFKKNFIQEKIHSAKISVSSTGNFWPRTQQMIPVSNWWLARTWDTQELIYSKWHNNQILFISRYLFHAIIVRNQCQNRIIWKIIKIWLSQFSICYVTIWVNCPFFGHTKNQIILTPPPNEPVTFRWRRIRF